MSTPAGWYPDPEDGARQRYWDGTDWTDHYAPLAPPSPPPLSGRRRNWPLLIALGLFALAALIYVGLAVRQELKIRGREARATEQLYRKDGPAWKLATLDDGYADRSNMKRYVEGLQRVRSRCDISTPSEIADFATTAQQTVGQQTGRRPRLSKLLDDVDEVMVAWPSRQSCDRGFSEYVQLVASGAVQP